MLIAGRGPDLAALSRAALTYPEVGATRSDLPTGYRHLERRERIGSGSTTFAQAAASLNGWRMHTGAGLTVLSAPATAEIDADVVTRIGPPVVGLIVPCRIVYVVDEPDRSGYALR